MGGRREGDCAGDETSDPCERPKRLLLNQGLWWHCTVLTTSCQKPESKRMTLYRISRISR